MGRLSVSQDLFDDLAVFELGCIVIAADEGLFPGFITTKV